MLQRQDIISGARVPDDGGCQTAHTCVCLALVHLDFRPTIFEIGFTAEEIGAPGAGEFQMRAASRPSPSSP